MVYYQVTGGFPDRTLMALEDGSGQSHGARMENNWPRYLRSEKVACASSDLVLKCGMKWHEYVQIVDRCLMIDNINSGQCS